MNNFNDQQNIFVFIYKVRFQYCFGFFFFYSKALVLFQYPFKNIGWWDFRC